MKLNRIFKLGITSFISVSSVASTLFVITTDAKASDKEVELVKTTATTQSQNTPSKLQLPITPLRPSTSTTGSPSYWKNAVEIETLEAPDSIYAATISPDGKTLFTGGSKFLQRWNLQTIESNYIFNGISNSNVRKYIFTSITTIPDSNELVTTSDGTYTETKSKTVKKNPSGCTSEFFKISCSLGGKTTATTYSSSSSSGPSMQVWDIENEQVLKTVVDDIGQTAFIPDSKILVTSSLFRDEIKLWNSQNGEVNSFKKFENDFNSVNCPPAINTQQSKYIAFPSYESHENSKNQLRILDINSGKTKQLLSISTKVGKLDRQTNKRLKKILALHGCTVFSPNGKILAGGISDAVFLWDWSTGKLVHQLLDKIPNLKSEDSFDVDGKQYKTSIAFTPDNQVIATSNHDGTIKLWNTKTGKLIKTLKGHRITQQEKPILHFLSPLFTVTSLNFTPDGRNLISTGADGKIKIWGVSRTEEI